MEQSKKSSQGLIFFVALLVGLLLGVGGSYYYFTQKEDTKKNTSDIKEEEKKEGVVEETLQPTGVFVTSLIERYDIYSISKSEIMKSLYSKDKLRPSELNESSLRFMIAKAANKNAYGVFSFTSQDFQLAQKKLFGNTIALADASIETGGCGSIIYQDGYYFYQEGSGCGGTSEQLLERKIIKATKKDQAITITVAVGIADGTTKKVYRDASLTEELHGITSETFDLEKDYDKLSKFSYHFAYDKDNNNYYLTSIEKES